MKSKIEIKHWLTGSILFEFECDGNTILKTLVEAVNKKANLRGANLYDADLRDADPRESWANWITAISNSLACGDWIGGDNYPQWVESAFNVLNAERTVAKSDSN